MPENLIERTKNTLPSEWTTTNIACILTEIYTDVKHIKLALSGKANKWTERVLGLFMVGTASWALMQVAKLIETAKAIF